MGFIAGFYPFRRTFQVREDAELKSFVTTKSGLILVFPPGSDEDSEIASAKQFSGQFPCFRIEARPKAKGERGGKGSRRNAAHHCAAAARNRDLKILTGSFDNLDGLAFLFFRPIENLPC